MIKTRIVAAAAAIAALISKAQPATVDSAIAGLNKSIEKLDRAAAKSEADSDRLFAEGTALLNQSDIAFEEADRAKVIAGRLRKLVA